MLAAKRQLKLLFRRQVCAAKLDDNGSRGRCVNSEDENDYVLPMWRYVNCTHKAPYITDKTFCGRERKR